MHTNTDAHRYKASGNDDVGSAAGAGAAAASVVHTHIYIYIYIQCVHRDGKRKYAGEKHTSTQLVLRLVVSLKLEYKIGGC